ncbi:META domain-containing protein [Devosia sp. WQ 349]|uniref:META domain-containing protein n=1 Tax=Devosia sp. WQ 349K1 TaxID=2800329 RepID=UPI001903DF61|nr:META domain-containing protein [Devosia sp. WQ 349K1]MBK1794011.1 META domain-containing protein [Devosia sp. WQ 349K1]
MLPRLLFRSVMELLMRTWIMLTLCSVLLATPALAQATTLTGDVTYRERIALPIPAELVVTLVELTTGTQIASATAPIPDRGQVPLSYSLNLHQQPAPENHYGLVAKILSRGAVVFQNYDPIAVDPASPKQTTIFVHRAGDVQPLIEEPQVLNFNAMTPTTSPLIDTDWTVQSVNGQAIEGPRKPSIGFDHEGRVYGTGGCNRYFTTATIAGTAISFGVGGTTNMACDAATMGREAAFFSALAEIVGFVRQDDVLQLIGTSGAVLLELSRNAAA